VYLDILGETSWGQGHIGTPVLRPEDHSFARVRITWQEWEQRKGTDDENPVPERLRFRDNQGRTHEVSAKYAGRATWVATVPM
jgi:hypothetical protein